MRGVGISFEVGVSVDSTPPSPERKPKPSASVTPNNSPRQKGFFEYYFTDAFCNGAKHAQMEEFCRQAAANEAARLAEVARRREQGGT